MSRGEAGCLGVRLSTTPKWYECCTGHGACQQGATFVRGRNTPPTLLCGRGRSGLIMRGMITSGRCNTIACIVAQRGARGCAARAARDSLEVQRVSRSHLARPTSAGARPATRANSEPDADAILS